MSRSLGPSRPRRAVWVLAATMLCNGTLWAQYRHTQDREPLPACGRFLNPAIGPLDYRNAEACAIEIVEKRHFTRQVETLKSGARGTIGEDIAYTLRAFPNHPRALRSAAEYERRKGREAVKDMGMSTECWLNRAVAFRVADPSVRIIAANEQIKRGQTGEAREHLVIAAENSGGNPIILYNLGLLYFELGDHERSMAFAKQAYALGVDLPGLREKLTRAGKWQE